MQSQIFILNYLRFFNGLCELQLEDINLKSLFFLANNSGIIIAAKLM